MDGFQVLRARKEAGISQGDLAKALNLSSRNSLTDVENGLIEITTDWAIKAISKIRELKTQTDTAA
jgi:transcriptional regulator with XRE-family HTH domain